MCDGGPELVALEESSLPGTASRLRAVPSMLGARRSIEFTVDGQDPGRVVILDVTGRTVAVLSLQPTPAGGAATWDGTEQSGGAVRSGTYFAELRRGGQRASCRVLVCD
jgi:hypothetical protein